MKLNEDWKAKMALQAAERKMAISRGLATRRPVKLMGTLALGALILAGIWVQFIPEAVYEPGRRPSVEVPQNVANTYAVSGDIGLTVKSNSPKPGLGNEVSLWIRPWARQSGPAVAAHPELQVRPWNDSGINLEARQSLIDLGFARVAGGQFQAAVADADDAGHGHLLLQAGYTEQQVRNSQERQRKASEEASADRWFQQMVPITALAELRRQGFANYQDQVHAAAADDAGHRDLLLNAGFTELQILDAQRRQRQIYEEAMADLWYQQLAQIQVQAGGRPLNQGDPN